MKLPSIGRHRSRIEIIPLIDIMFFLLASFMMISIQMDRTQNIRVNLPMATQAARDFKPDMLNIAVDKAGGVWLERREIPLSELAAALTNRYRLDTNQPVYVTADRDTLHGAMADVYEIARRSGIQKVAFAVRGAGTQ